MGIQLREHRIRIEYVSQPLPFESNYKVADAMFTKLKVWLVAAGAGILAVGFLLLRIFTLGKKVERAESLERTVEESNELQDHVNRGHAAGADVAAGRVQPISDDPNDRANERKNR